MIATISPLRIFIAIACVHIVFATYPSLDLLVSGLFFDETAGFWVEDFPFMQALREGLWMLMTALCLVCFAGACLRFVLPKLRTEQTKVFELVTLIYLLGPILLVNAILKNYWGRARPANVTDFGGTLEFSPPFEIAGQCAANCSFTSGEGAGAAALLIGALLLSHVFAPQKSKWVLGVVGVVAFTAMALRVVMGRHFTSDAIFSFLFVAMIAALLIRLKRYSGLFVK